jgi:hypothetical protein
MGVASTLGTTAEDDAVKHIATARVVALSAMREIRARSRSRPQTLRDLSE